jgi:hypothetical protein
MVLRLHPAIIIIAGARYGNLSFNKDSILSPFYFACVQQSWTTLAGVSPVTVIASEPCS